MASVEEVAAGLRAMGYSTTQARRLAGCPDTEPKRIVAARMSATTMLKAPRVSQKATNGRPVATGQSPDDYRAGPRWGAQRKALTVEFVREGLIDPVDLMARHGLTAEELKAWGEAYDAGGPKALKAAPARKIAP